MKIFSTEVTSKQQLEAALKKAMKEVKTEPKNKRIVNKVILQKADELAQRVQKLDQELEMSDPAPRPMSPTVEYIHQISKLSSEITTELEELSQVLAPITKVLESDEVGVAGDRLIESDPDTDFAELVYGRVLELSKILYRIRFMRERISL